MKINEIKKALENQLNEKDVSRILAQLKKDEAKDAQSPQGIFYSNLEKCTEELANIKVMPAYHDYTLSANDKGSINVISNWVAPKIFGSSDNVLKLFAKALPSSDITEGKIKNPDQVSTNKLGL